MVRQTTSSWHASQKGAPLPFATSAKMAETSSALVERWGMAASSVRRRVQLSMRRRRAPRRRAAARSLARPVANHFDVVPVGTDDESGIVVRRVLEAQTGRAVVLAAGLQSRAMESVDLPAILGHEREVKMRRLLVGLEDAQRRLPIRAELDAERPFLDDGDAERLERLEEERLHRCTVARSEYDVVEHGRSY